MDEKKARLKKLRDDVVSELEGKGHKVGFPEYDKNGICSLDGVRLVVQFRLKHTPTYGFANLIQVVFGGWMKIRQKTLTEPKGGFDPKKIAKKILDRVEEIQFQKKKMEMESERKEAARSALYSVADSLGKRDKVRGVNTFFHDVGGFEIFFRAVSKGLVGVNIEMTPEQFGRLQVFIENDGLE